MASERSEQLRTLVLSACEDLGTHGLQTTPDAIAAVSALIVNASRLGAEVDAAAEIARLRAIIEADGLDPDAPIPPGLALENERLRRELEEARERERAIVEACVAVCESRATSHHREKAPPGWLDRALEAQKCASAIREGWHRYLTATPQEATDAP